DIPVVCKVAKLVDARRCGGGDGQCSLCGATGELVPEKAFVDVSSAKQTDPVQYRPSARRGKGHAQWISDNNGTGTRSDRNSVKREGPCQCLPLAVGIGDRHVHASRKRGWNVRDQRRAAPLNHHCLDATNVYSCACGESGTRNPEKVPR